MCADRSEDDNDPNVNRPHGIAPVQASKTNAKAWKYFEPYDPPDSRPNAANKMYRRCKFCREYFTDHATRAKHHLYGNVVKGDAPPCQKLYGHLSLQEINKMYYIIGTPPNKKFRTSSGGHQLLSNTIWECEASTPTSQASIQDSNQFDMDEDTNMEERAPTAGRSKSSRLNPIRNGYQVPNRERLDRLWARAFYSAGVAFNVAENPFFQEAIKETSKGDLPGYCFPSRRHFAQNLLKETKGQLAADMATRMASCQKYGYSLSSDGWENTRREPINNIMLMTKNGNFFIDSWNAAQADKKDNVYLGDMWCKYIDDIGPEHIIQIVTDGAPANRVAGKEIVMRKYPHVTWSWCAAHVFNLLLEDMCGRHAQDENGNNPFKPILNRLRWIVKAISMSQKLSAIFIRKSPRKKLLNPAATRFATNFIMAQRALELRMPLQQMVIDEKWPLFRNSLPQSENARGIMTKTRADELKDWIQKDPFWDQVKATVDFFIPLVKMLREFDGTSPQSSWLYWTLKRGFYDLQKNCRDCPLITREIASKMEGLYKSRQESLTTDFMLAAAYVNPTMFFNEDVDVAGNAELNRGYMTYIARYAEQEVKQGPNHAHEVQLLVRKINMQSLEAQQKRPRSSVSLSIAQSAIMDMSPGEWWHFHGADYTELRNMAKKITHQRMTSSACERNWSAYGFIHSKSRNKLTNDRAKDLVFIFTNLRVEKGLTKIKNPHSAIYNRYYENQLRLDAVMPLSANMRENHSDSSLAAEDDKILEDMDAIDVDDVDVALQGDGLQYEEETLVCSARDKYGTQDYIGKMSWIR